MRAAPQAASSEDPPREPPIFDPRPPSLLTRALAGVALAAVAWTCSTATDTGSEPPGSVLFIGNSLTYTNDMPALTHRVAEAADDSLRVGMVAGPDLAVIDHTDGHTDAPAQIAKGKFGVVVMQQGITRAGICRDTLVIAAMRLAPIIRQAGGRPALWVSWERRSDPGTLDAVTESAVVAARAVGGIVLPIGIAWRDALARDPSLPLYGPDGYHPAPAGSLLAALTAYDRITGGDVRNIPVDRLTALVSPTLTVTQILTLVDAAHGASTSMAPDPPVPAPADTVHLSTSGGPC